VEARLFRNGEKPHLQGMIFVFPARPKKVHDRLDAIDADPRIGGGLTSTSLSLAAR
jgi:hypothetical protein